MNPGDLAPEPALLGNRPYCQKLGLFAGEGGVSRNKPDKANEPRFKNWVGEK